MSSHAIMKQRRLGGAGPLVGEVGFGTMGLAGFYGAITEEEAIAAVHRALDVGMTLINSADFYGAGAVERIIGRAIAGRAGRCVIATKIGMRLDANGRPTIIDGTPAHLREAVEASLARLRIEAIDVVVLCRLDPRVPIEESLGGLADLVAQGKARSIGLSEVSSRTIRRAHAVHAIAAVEVELSLWERQVERAILPAARELDIGVLAHTPLGRGFLTGTYASGEDLPSGDHRRQHPRFDGENFAKNRALVDRVIAIARRHEATPAQIALAWLLRAGPNVIPIPGTRRIERIEENSRAAGVELTDIDMAELDETFAPGRVSGARQAPYYLAAVDQD